MSADLRSGAEALESPKPVTGASEVASHWKAIGSAIGQTQAAQNASLPPESWTGKAADAASSEIQALGGKLSGLSGQFATPASALTTWEERNSQGIKTVESLQTQWDEAVAAYKKTKAEIDARAATDKEYNPASDLKAAESTLASAQAPLKKSYDDEIHQLSDAANTAATEIQKTSNDTIPADVVKGGRAAVGAELFGKDMPIADGAAEWDYARTKAPQLRDDLEKAADSDKPLTEAEVKKLQEKWGDKLQNPYWVQALADSYREKHGKDANFSDMLNRLTVNAAGSPSLSSGEEGETRNSFVNSIGNAMVLATGGSDASKDGIATSAEYAQVKAGLRGHDGKTTIEQIEHANIESFKSTGDKVYDRQQGGSSMDGYEIFTQATGFAGVKNPDLTFGKEVYEGGADSLVGKIVEYDQKHPSMTAMNPGAGVDLYSIVHSTDADDKAWKLSHDPLQSLFQLSDTPNSIADGSAPSVLQNVEGTRLMHLRDFLNSKTSFDVDLPEGREDGKITFARYLTGNRHADNFDLLGNIDGGEALGDMLNDASNPKTADVPEPPASDATAHKIWKNDRLTRAAIAANTMAGYQDGLDHSHWALFGDADHVKGEDVFGHKNHALRSWMGSIIEPYVYDLASEMHHSTGSGMNAGASPDVYDSVKMKFGGPLVDRFKQPGGLLQDLAFDRPKVTDDGGTPDYLLDDKYEGGRRPALQVVQTAAYQGYMGDVAEALKDTNYASRTSGVEGATNRWTELIQETFDANPDKDSAIGKALDESHRNARKIAEFIVDVSVGYAGKQVPVAGPLVTTTIKGAAGAGLDWALSTDNEMKGWESRYEANRASRQLMQDGLVRAMYDSDQWTERAGAVDVSPGTQEYEHKKLPALNPDGTRRAFGSLEPGERDQVRNYFTGKDSDFRTLLDDQYNAQQNAQSDGREEKPSSGGK